MTTETSHLAETVPTTIQIKIFSYLNVIDLIQNVNVLSKEYNHMVSNDSVLWRQLNVRQLTISTQRGYGMYPIVKSIFINGTELEDPPIAFLSKFKDESMPFFEKVIHATCPQLTVSLSNYIIPCHTEPIDSHFHAFSLHT
eukprot:744497_1